MEVSKLFEKLCQRGNVLFIHFKSMRPFPSGYVVFVHVMIWTVTMRTAVAQQISLAGHVRVIPVSNRSHGGVCTMTTQNSQPLVDRNLNSTNAVNDTVKHDVTTGRRVESKIV
ncbi:MAG: hypothetical protein ACREX3_02935 [Gammaproteobacteria bacterium]